MSIAYIERMSDVNTIAPTTEYTGTNRKTRYYYKNKDKQEFKDRLFIARQKYYEKNKEQIIAKALDRYYKLKALQNVPTEE